MRKGVKARRRKMRGNKNLGMMVLVIVACFLVALGVEAGCGKKGGDTSGFSVKASVKGGHGAVDPESQTVPAGESASIDMRPDAGYRVASITDNGDPMPVSDPYVIADVAEDHEVEVVFEEGASGGPDGEETFAASITSQVTYEQFAWSDSGGAEFTASPAIEGGDNSEAEGGISGTGTLTLTGSGEMYSCSGTNQLTIGGYYVGDMAYLAVDVSSSGTVVAGGFSNAFTESYSYGLEFDMEQARSGGCTVTVPVESGSTTWNIVSTGRVSGEPVPGGGGDTEPVAAGDSSQPAPEGGLDREAEMEKCRSDVLAELERTLDPAFMYDPRVISMDETCTHAELGVFCTDATGHPVEGFSVLAEKQGDTWVITEYITSEE